MPTLTIDNQTVTVPQGTNVLDAAAQLGIEIPHLCYHEALGSVGACRLCAVKFLEGPVKGVQMSCMVEARDGMVVSTDDPEALAYRAQVMEWLMTNHPHDCPVCDAGGECQLQEMTVAGGHGQRRYSGPKRTYVNQDLGPFVAHEMNRCIQCYRCVRTYQDYCGGTDFGVLGSRQRLYFGRFCDGPLESPFAGNLVDVCPTGVLTDKTRRFKSRSWDLLEAPSICPHCSLGCAVTPGARYRELQRRRARTNRFTNGHFICDRGRFGYGYANLPERPREPLIGHRQATWQEGLSTLRNNIGELLEYFGPNSVALLASPRASLETQFLLARWAKALSSDRLCFDAHAGRDRSARVAAARPSELIAGLEDVRQSDLAVLVGADPLAEAPMLALALRQAVRHGGRVVVLDPRPVELPLPFERHVARPEQLAAFLQGLAAPEQDHFPAALDEAGRELARQLRAAEKPVLIGGNDLLGAAGCATLLTAAKACSDAQRPCRTMLLPAGPNAVGGALLAGDGPDFDELLAGMEAGKIKALLCVEADPLGDHPDRRRVKAALTRLDLLAVWDGVASATMRQADLFFPSAVVEETGGTFINNENRMQAFARVFEPGTPMAQAGRDSHPPRFFDRTAPGHQPRPAWTVLADLAGREPSLATVRQELEQAEPRLAGLSELSAGDEGRCLAAGTSDAGTPATPVPLEEPGDRLRLLVTETLYGSDLLSDLSPHLQAVKPAAHALLHPRDGMRLELKNGKPVRIIHEDGELTVALRLCADMAPGRRWCRAARRCSAGWKEPDR
jgi:NADH-quinone oxidoreductase subunit G